MLFFLLLSLSVLACAFIWTWPVSEVRSLLSWREDFQQTGWCGSAEAGAADFAGDTFVFVTETHHSAKDVGSRAVTYHPRCNILTICVHYTAELSSLACKPCAISTQCEHYAVPSPLVSAGCFPLHGSELSCSTVCVVITTAAHRHVPAKLHWATRLLRHRAHWFSWFSWSSLSFLSQLQRPTD